jgi:hypothetical protein
MCDAAVAGCSWGRWAAGCLEWAAAEGGERLLLLKRRLCDIFKGRQGWNARRIFFQFWMMRCAVVASRPWRVQTCKNLGSKLIRIFARSACLFLEPFLPNFSPLMLWRLFL